MNTVIDFQHVLQNGHRNCYGWAAAQGETKQQLGFYTAVLC